jgi:hypothetical protein
VGGFAGWYIFITYHSNQSIKVNVHKQEKPEQESESTQNTKVFP